LDILTKRLDYNDNYDGIVIAVDRIGVKVTNRGLSGCMISRVQERRKWLSKNTCSC